MKEKEKGKTNKLEDKKPNKNITQTNIKTHQEYKGGALPDIQTCMEDRQ